MISTQSLTLLLLGLALGVQANKGSTPYTPLNKTHHNTEVKPAIASNALYMQYACQHKKDGHRLPIEESCTQFLECQNGLAKLKACKNGQHFSNFALACIDARLSKCSVKACECCDKPNGLYPDSKNCSNFIACIDGQAISQSCGEFFKFSDKTLTCDIPARAHCKGHPPNRAIVNRKIAPLAKTYKIPMYMTSYKICRQSSNGQAIGIPGSCNKFYLCINGIGHLKSCGSMQFNFETHYCDSRTRVLCPEFDDSELILKHDERPEESANIEDLQPPHGKPSVEEQIPLAPPTVGYPEMTTQVPIADPVPEIINPKELNALCTKQSVGALVAWPKHCGKYIRCKWDWFERRVAEVETCPTNKHFNAKTKLCDDPENAGCKIY